MIQTFGPVHQSVMAQIKNFVSEDWIGKIIVEHGLLSVSIEGNNSIEKWQ